MVPPKPVLQGGEGQSIILTHDELADLFEAKRIYVTAVYKGDAPWLKNVSNEISIQHLLGV
ncbi:hypothetical protein JCM18905_3515 [Vibrio sp. JCM 18905]|nr:hypothetical protein JCM18905_3515 [Vibrio sp. JCM 18905]